MLLIAVRSTFHHRRLDNNSPVLLTAAAVHATTQLERVDDITCHVVCTPSVVGDSCVWCSRHIATATVTMGDATTTTTLTDGAAWENIAFRDLTVRETIGGGGVALVHRGYYRQQPVALKTLVQPRAFGA